MSERGHEIPAGFLEAADRFVALANEMSEVAPPGWVRAAMMFATARYNAFTWVVGDEHPGQTIDQAAAHFRREYETMFRENVGEIEPAYRAARREKPQ